MRGAHLVEAHGQPDLVVEIGGSPHVTVGPKGWRPFGGRGGRPSGPRVARGNYTVKLRVGEKEMAQSMTVLKDPHSAGTEGDIQAQLEMQLQVRDDINSIAEMCNQIEWIRKQLKDLDEILEEGPEADPIRNASGSLEGNLEAAENHFFDLRLAWQGQDTLRWPDKLHTRLAKLAGALDQTDFSPTDQQREVHEMLRKELDGQRLRPKELTDRDLKALNGSSGRRTCPNIITPTF